MRVRETFDRGAIVKFSEVKRELAKRTYDDVIRTFASNGVVDEETQKNDLDIVRLVAKVNKEVPIERADNFSFAAQGDKKLTRAAGGLKNNAKTILVAKVMR